MDRTNKYHSYDTFYDYEVLKNITSVAYYRPKEKKFVVSFYTKMSENGTENAENEKFKLELTDKNIEDIEQYVWHINHKRLRELGLERSDLTLNQDLTGSTDFLAEEAPEKGGTVFGYNSQGYDNAIISYIRNEAPGTNDPEKFLATDTLREFSDRIIERQNGNIFAVVRDQSRKSNSDIFTDFLKMRRSDAHIDIALLNPKSRYTGLNRLSAQAGFPIITSESLGDDAPPLKGVHDVADLLAYNVSDVINEFLLFEENDYQQSFHTNEGLLERYSDAQFKGKGMARDSSSASFIEMVIAPNQPLEDNEKVSYAYPVVRDYMPDDYEKEITQALQKYGKVKEADTIEGFNDAMATLFKQWSQTDSANKLNKELSELDPQEEELNIPRFIDSLCDNPSFPHMDNVFFWDGDRKYPRIDYYNGRFMFHLLNLINYEHQLEEDTDNHLDKIYQYYTAFEGKDVTNTADRRKYVKALGDPDIVTGVDATLPNNSPVYIRMSIGGAHGNIIDRDAYEAHRKDTQHYNNTVDEVRKFYLTHLEKEGLTIQEQYDKYIKEEITPNQQRNWKKLSADKQKEAIAATLARRTRRDGLGNFNEPKEWEAEGIDPYDATTGAYGLGRFKAKRALRKAGRFTVTLDAKDIMHVDISSYYPALIINLGMFEAGDDDPYRELRDERIKLRDSLPYDISQWTQEDHDNNDVQNINKLLLNSASGAADATFDNNIRINNKTFQMRVSGQLIILDLALQLAERGAVANSINTDGIFFHGIDYDEAVELVDTWKSRYGLEADTEQLHHFYSKDSNNRIEINENDQGERYLFATGGGSTSHWTGPDVSSNVNTPPIADNALVTLALEEDFALTTFTRDWAKKHIQRVIQESIDADEKIKSLPEGKPIPDKLLDTRNKAFSMLQYLMVSNRNSGQYFVYHTEGDGWSYPSSLNRVFFIDKASWDESPYALTHPASQVGRLRVHRTNRKHEDDALRAALDLGITTQEYLDENKNEHVAFMRATDISSDVRPQPGVRQNERDYGVIFNDAWSDIDVVVLNYIDLNFYVNIIERVHDSWSEDYVVYRPELDDNYNLISQTTWTKENMEYWLDKAQGTDETEDKTAKEKENVPKENKATTTNLSGGITPIK